MKAHLFCIECLTNLHVGSGESNYNIIDNEVERDLVLANVPVIHASGVKGALRAHCRGADWETRVFGPKSNASGMDDTPGGVYKFFTANLLARPLRVSQGDASYVLATSQEILDRLKNLAAGLGVSLKLSLGEKVEVQAEGQAMTACAYAPEALFGNGKIAIAPKGFADIDLPSLARNSLDDKGISKNLWYEEIVPYTSRFYFFVLAPEDDGDYEAFRDAIAKDGVFVQFGGNASVGYGYCRVKEVKLP